LIHFAPNEVQVLHQTWDTQPAMSLTFGCHPFVVMAFCKNPAGSYFYFRCVEGEKAFVKYLSPQEARGALIAYPKVFAQEFAENPLAG
jgi:hypothetical protein